MGNRFSFCERCGGKLKTSKVCPHIHMADLIATLLDAEATSEQIEITYRIISYVESLQEEIIKIRKQK